MSSSSHWSDNLVESLDEVRTNAKRFWNNGQLPQTKYAWYCLSKYQHWYYFDDLKLFAPCKFIGYRRTTLNSYIGAGHGSYTRNRLKRWFTIVPRPSKEFDRLSRALATFCENNDKSLNKSVTQTHGAIYVLKPEFRYASLSARKQSDISTSRRKSQKPSFRNMEGQPSERDQTAAARIGQDVFRNKLLRRWKGACAISGCKNRKLLRASHIVPWRDCSDNDRFSPDNGLPLMPHLDAAFDTGLFSFDDNGRIIISSTLSARDRRLLGISRSTRITIRKGNVPYLQKHRKRHRL